MSYVLDVYNKSKHNHRHLLLQKKIFFVSVNSGGTFLFTTLFIHSRIFNFGLLFSFASSPQLYSALTFSDFLFLCPTETGPKSPGITEVSVVLVELLQNILRLL